MDHRELYSRAKLFALKHRRPLLRAGAAAFLCAAAGVFALFGPPRMIELTESPQFCALCHFSQNRDWRHSPHRGQKCIDCHLPNNNFANHYLWKSIDGGKDVYCYYSGLGDASDIVLTGHGKKVLQANCIRCHADMVSRMDKKRSCTDCHRSLGHRSTARILTREEMTR